jgi:hypothetical protein
MHWVLLVVATGTGLLGAWFAASALGLRDTLNRVLAVAVIFEAGVTSTLLIAGAGFSALAAGPVTGLVIAPSAVAAVAWLRAGRPPGGLGCPSVVVRRWGGAAREHPFAFMLLVLAGLAVLWRVYVGVVMPPYGTDATWYHLTAVAGWIRAEDLGRSRLSLESATYPLNGELLQAWSVLFLHSDALANLTQIPFACVGGIAVAGIVRTLGLDRSSQVVAGSLYVLTPIVLAQSSTAYVDLMFASSLLIGIQFVLCFLVSMREAPELSRVSPLRGEPLRFLLLAGLSLGLALGIKTTGLIATLVVLLLIAGDLTLRQRRRVPLGQVAAAIALLVVVAAGVGGFWYIRDWIDFGNPVYPFRVDGVFSGSITAASLERSSLPPTLVGNPVWLQVIRSWGHDLIRVGSLEPYSYDERLGGLGTQWPMMLCLLALTLFSCFRRRWWLRLEFIGTLGLVWLLEPYHWWSRFTIYLAALGAAAVAIWTSETVVPVLRRTVEGATLATVAISLYLVTAELPLGYGRELSLAQVIALSTKSRDQDTVGRIVCPSFRWVDQIPQAASIGIDPRYPTLIYALFGRNLSHPVRPVWASTRTAFLGQARRVNYIMLPDRDVERRWADSLPKVFRRVYIDAEMRVYRVQFWPSFRAQPTPRSGSVTGCPAPTIRPNTVNAALMRIIR